MADAQNAPFIQGNSKKKDTKVVRMDHMPIKDISSIATQNM